MVSVAQTKKLMSPFLRRHPEFVARGRDFFKVPVTSHVAASILIDRSGDKNAYRVYLQLYPLVCVKRAGFFAPFYIQYRWRRRSYWQLDDPEWTEALQTLLDTTIMEEIQMLSSLKNLWSSFESNREKWSMSSGGMESPEINPVMLAALGDFAGAERFCSYSYSVGWRRNNPALTPVFVDLWPALQSGDRVRIAKVLHGWERETIAGLKLEKHWQPAHFEWE